MTKKLYYTLGYETDFTARVEACNIHKEVYEVVLDQTAFYPEGGGQPADQGQLEEGEVSDVRIKEGIIYHYVDTPFEVGALVRGKVDFKRRFDLMQQHSGEHILSGLIKKHYGYQNVGFHLNETYMTCDFDGELSKEQVRELENLVNEAIYQNVPIECNVYEAEEIQNKHYRSKLDLKGEVRLVHISEYDLCACCGTHVQYSGEIGVVKCINSERHRGGMRLTLLCGERAMKDYQQKQEVLDACCKMLSTQSDKVSEYVGKILEGSAELKQKQALLMQQLFEYKIKDYLMQDEEGIFIMEEGLAPEELRRLCLMMSEKTDKAILILSGEAENYKYALGSKTKNMSELNKALTKNFSGKGGGKPELCQGSLSGIVTEIKAFYQQQIVLSNRAMK